MGSDEDGRGLVPRAADISALEDRWTGPRCPVGHTRVTEQRDGSWLCQTCAATDWDAGPIYEREQLQWVGEEDGEEEDGAG